MLRFDFSATYKVLIQMQNTVTYSIGNKIPVYVGNYVRKFATLDFKTHLAAFLNHVNQTN